ncbi:glycosyltransferase [bacterium]|nr:glycosyltransferase [bacterium]
MRIESVFRSAKPLNKLADSNEMIQNILYKQKSFPSLSSNLESFNPVRSPWAFLRSWRQETIIRREQSYYETLAKQRGLLVPTEASLSEALAKRLAHRRVNLIGLKKGEIHTFYCGGLDIWEEHNSLAAVKLFGPVSEFHVRQRGYRPYTPHWLNDRKRFNCELLEHIKAIHQRSPIHLFFTCAAGYTFFAKTIEAINRLGIITCGYHMDDRLYFRGQRFDGLRTGPAAVAASFDLCLTNSMASRIKYVVEGGRPLFWPAGANPEIFKPLKLTRKFEVSFVGSGYGQRAAWILWLRQKGVKVTAFGPGWPGGELSTKEMVEIYARSHICLGFSGIGYSMREFCLKGRDFEVPMSGAVYLTCEQPDLHRVYKVGQEVLTYDSREQCLERIRRLLKNPNQSEQIRKAALTRSLREHTWEQRFDKLFRIIGVYEEDKHGS